MTRLTRILLVGLAVGTCAHPIAQERPHRELAASLHRLASFLALPGFTATVLHGGRVVFRQTEGFADIETREPLRDDTLFGIASVTKTFTGVILRQLEDEGQISLDDYLLKYPINSYFPAQIVGDANLRIKDVVSMTAGDKPGETYFYNGTRFNLLYGLFDTVSKTETPESYMLQVRHRIIERLHMDDTFCGYSSIPDARKHRMAKRYELVATNGAWKYQRIDRYWDVTWPSGGLITTIDDLFKYTTALDDNALISKVDYEKMTTPRTNSRGEPHPYAYGWFSQTFEGNKVDWHSGASQGESAMFVRVPGKRLTFVFLANSNVPSVVSQTVYGDIARSPFALAFLKEFVADDAERSQRIDFDEPIEQLRGSLKRMRGRLAQEELLNEALLYAYKAEMTQRDEARAIELTETLYGVAPDQFKRNNPVLLYLLSRLNSQTLAAGARQLLNAFDPVSDKRPMVALWIGNFYAKQGLIEKAIAAYEVLADRSGFDDELFKAQACERLAELFTAKQDLARGREYLWKSALISAAKHDSAEYRRKVSKLSGTSP